MRTIFPTPSIQRSSIWTVQRGIVQQIGRPIKSVMVHQTTNRIRMCQCYRWTVRCDDLSQWILEPNIIGCSEWTIVHVHEIPKLWRVHNNIPKMDLAFSHLVAVYRYLDNSSTMCVRRRSGCTLNAWELDTNTHILQNKNIVCLQYHTTPPPPQIRKFVGKLYALLRKIISLLVRLSNWNWILIILIQLFDWQSHPPSWKHRNCSLYRL